MVGQQKLTAKAAEEAEAEEAEATATGMGNILDSRRRANHNSSLFFSTANGAGKWWLEEPSSTSQVC